MDVLNLLSVGASIALVVSFVVFVLLGVYLFFIWVGSRS
jgi:hypothetical protein